MPIIKKKERKRVRWEWREISQHINVASTLFHCLGHMLTHKTGVWDRWGLLNTECTCSPFCIYSTYIAHIRICIKPHVPSIIHQSGVSLKNAAIISTADNDVPLYPNSLVWRTVTEDKFRFIFSDASGFGVRFHTTCSFLTWWCCSRCLTLP